MKLFCLLSILMTGSAFAEPLSLPTDLKLKFAVSQVLVTEPHEHAAVAFRALSLEPVLDALAPGWRKQEIVTFICADGYRVPVPARDILANAGRGYLAIERGYAAGQADEGFSVSKPEEGGRVKLDPYYLVWTRAAGQSEVATDFWPYQVTQIEIGTYEKNYPKATLKQLTPELKRAQRLFMSECISCHSVNGTGGGRGPMLLGTAGIAPSRTDEELLEKITDPTRGGKIQTFMPARSAEDASLILGYLRALQKQGQ
jgi:hypothetical protein